MPSILSGNAKAAGPVFIGKQVSSGAPLVVMTDCSRKLWLVWHNSDYFKDI